MTRILGALALLLLAPGLTGCGDDRAGSDDVDRLEQAIDDAVAGVVHDLADALDAQFEAGTRRSAWCGESYAPRGVLLESFVRLGPPAELTDDAAADAALRTLTDDGWTASRTGGSGPPVVRATREELEIRVELGGGHTQVTVSHADCLETSDDVAREVHERPAADIDW